MHLLFENERAHLILFPTLLKKVPWIQAAVMHPTPRILLSLLLICVAPTVRAHEGVAQDMVKAATVFLDSLSTEQRAKAVFALNDAERENWFFVPRDREGLPFKEMSTIQQALGLALLRTGLSHSGFRRAEEIISLELVLKELEGGAARRDPTLYYVTIFGSPSDTKSWGWRFEGHHLSFNFTVVDGHHIAFAPSFIGSNPAEVPIGPRKGERVLADEDDLGRAFMKSLSPAQQRVARFSDKAPADIFTTNKKQVEPLEPAGIAFMALTPPQRDALVALVKLYIGRWRPELAAETFAKITTAGLDTLTFAWAGGLEPGDGNYYRIQGPTFVIEFDNVQNRANHIHTAFRDFEGDFGRDLLREHYQQHKH